MRRIETRLQLQSSLSRIPIQKESKHGVDLGGLYDRLRLALAYEENIHVWK